MTRDEAKLLMNTIDLVAQDHSTCQYDDGSLSIDERGIEILKTLIRGLANKESDNSDNGSGSQYNGYYIPRQQYGSYYD